MICYLSDWIVVFWRWEQLYWAFWFYKVYNRYGIFWGKGQKIFLIWSPILLAYIYLNKWEMSPSNYGNREIHIYELISLVVGIFAFLSKLKRKIMLLKNFYTRKMKNHCWIMLRCWSFIYLEKEPRVYDANVVFVQVWIQQALPSLENHQSADWILLMHNLWM